MKSMISQSIFITSSARGWWPGLVVERWSRST